MQPNEITISEILSLFFSLAFHYLRAGNGHDTAFLGPPSNLFYEARFLKIKTKKLMDLFFDLNGSGQHTVKIKQTFLRIIPL